MLVFLVCYPDLSQAKFLICSRFLICRIRSVFQLYQVLSDFYLIF